MSNDETTPDINDLRRKAEQGDADAQCELGQAGDRSKKSKLIAKLTGVCRFVGRYEELAIASRECEHGLDAAEEKLSKRKRSLARNLFMPIVYIGGILGIFYWATGDMLHFLSQDQKPFAGFLGLLQGLTVAVLALLTIKCIVMIPIRILQIPVNKLSVSKNKKYFENSIEAVKQLIVSMPDEKADADEMFPSDNVLDYPRSKYIKHGIDALKSGRANNFKEVAALMDELAHRETLEAQAAAQTEYARESAENSRAALYAARNAESAARAAASDAAAARRNSGGW